MAVILLPDAQEDLLSLQDYRLTKWGVALWLKAEEEIFEKLTAIDTGHFNGTPVTDLAFIGIFDYDNVLTSHHRIVYKKNEIQDLYLPPGGAAAGFPDAASEAAIQPLKQIKKVS